MTTFQNFYNLRKIEDEVLRKAEFNDLRLFRDHIPVIDGYILIICAGYKESLKMIFLSDEKYKSFTKAEKEYYLKYYNIFTENM